MGERNFWSSCPQGGGGDKMDMIWTVQDYRFWAKMIILYLIFAQNGEKSIYQPKSENVTYVTLLSQNFV